VDAKCGDSGDIHGLEFAAGIGENRIVIAAIIAVDGRTDCRSTGNGSERWKSL
jgi:hypothetical protein